MAPRMPATDSEETKGSGMEEGAGEEEAGEEEAAEEDECEWGGVLPRFRRAEAQEHKVAAGAQGKKREKDKDPDKDGEKKKKKKKKLAGEEAAPAVGKKQRRISDAADEDDDERRGGVGGAEGGAEGEAETEADADAVERAPSDVCETFANAGGLKEELQQACADFGDGKVYSELCVLWRSQAYQVSKRRIIHEGSSPVEVEDAAQMDAMLKTSSNKGGYWQNLALSSVYLIGGKMVDGPQAGRTSVVPMVRVTPRDKAMMRGRDDDCVLREVPSKVLYNPGSVHTGKIQEWLQELKTQSLDPDPAVVARAQATMQTFKPVFDWHPDHKIEHTKLCVNHHGVGASGHDELARNGFRGPLLARPQTIQVKPKAIGGPGASSVGNGGADNGANRRSIVSTAAVDTYALGPESHVHFFTTGGIVYVSIVRPAEDEDEARDSGKSAAGLVEL